jgi:hypothetical protein
MGICRGLTGQRRLQTDRLGEVQQIFDKVAERQNQQDGWVGCLKAGEKGTPHLSRGGKDPVCGRVAAARLPDHRRKSDGGGLSWAYRSVLPRIP